MNIFADSVTTTRLNALESPQTGIGTVHMTHCALIYFNVVGLCFYHRNLSVNSVSPIFKLTKICQNIPSCTDHQYTFR